MEMQQFPNTTLGVELVLPVDRLLRHCLEVASLRWLRMSSRRDISQNPQECQLTV